MQATPSELPPLGIVFDSDMGRTIDDALALALLYGAQGREDVQTTLASVSVTTPSIPAAAFCEAVNRFNSEIADRDVPERFRRNRTGIIGLAENGPGSDETPLAAILEQKNDDGEPLYPTDIERMIDTADPAALIRNALTAYDDQNALVLLTGPATNLAKVLSLNGAKELIAAKAKFLVVSASKHNFTADIEAAKKLFDEWPTPIVVVEAEVGQQLPFPAASIENDFSWTPRHPIVDAYRAFGEMPYDAPASDLAAALYTARPDAGYFETSASGTIEVLDDGGMKFTPSADGKHSRLTVDAAKKEAIIAVYRDFVGAEPAARVLPERFRKLIEEERKKIAEEEAAKAAEQPEQQ